jgi:outer membrane protein assembly factor BamB
MRIRRLLFPVIGIVLCTLAAPGFGGDWPMWRYDAHRSGASPEGLADELQLQWVRDLPGYQPAWPNEPRLHFDTCYEPILADGRVLLGSPLDGSVRAFSAETGAEQWRFYTGGPVRFAPVGWQGRVFAGSDDGYLYCLAAHSGALLWRARGAPDGREDRWHLGNARLISFWPVRGGPVIEDGVVYFAAGFWPAMGVFIKALDAETGETLWANGDAGRLQDVRIDHNVLRESGLSPQGYLLAAGGRLVVPNGRSMPARFDQGTGRMLYYVQGYRNGDCRIVATDQYAFVGRTGLMNMADGREVGSQWAQAGEEAPAAFDASRFHLFEGPFHPYKFAPGCDAFSVLDDGLAYGMQEGTFYAYDLDAATRTTYEKDYAGHTLTPVRWDPPLVWTLATEYAKDKAASQTLIKAGDRLYGHAGKVLICLSLPKADAEPVVAWTRELEGTPGAMAAADGRLLVATREGKLYCFGAAAGEPVIHALAPAPLEPADERWRQTAADIIAQTGVTEGYCLVVGLESGGLVTELLRQSELSVIALDPDPARAVALCERLVAAGAYARRAQVLVGDPTSLALPPYLASLIVSEVGLPFSQLARLPSVLRPYGGTLCLPGFLDAADAREIAADSGLEGLEVAATERFALIRRPGALNGSASWTHESADPARTYASSDDLVKPPLGVLWYGDGEGYGFYKYKDYGTGVKPQVIEGRLFAFQVFSRTLQAMDVYTGRHLWQAQVDPFARYASLADGVYVAGSDGVTVYDAATGQPRTAYSYGLEEDVQPQVADIRVSDDLIVVAVAFEKVRVIEKGLWDSAMLVALDRETGRQLWTRRAEERFNNHAIALGGGAVFCIDSLSGAMAGQMERRGEVPEQSPSTILALDARTGGERWRLVTANPFRTYDIGHWLSMRGNDDWLAYCAEANLVLVGKATQAHAINAATGEEVWSKRVGGGQPFVLQGSSFMTQSGHSYDARTGELLSEEQAFTRGGCNYAVATPRLILVRDYSVCYVDRQSGEKHYLRNIRSGCSNSLVAADGILNAPCFSVRCVCNYPIQTSFAMVHMPQAAAWDGATPMALAPPEQ